MEPPTGTPIPGKDYFTALPTEVLEMITGQLAFFKKLELRRVFPKVESPFVTKMLKPTLATLYVSPNRISVEHFGEICRVDFFRRQVKTVVFVPLTLRRFSFDENDEDVGIDYADSFIETFDEYRKRNPELSRREAQDSFNLYRSSVDELSRYSTDVTEVDDESEEEEEEISEELSQALYAGLIRLPALKTVGVASRIDQEGLNSNWCMLSTRLKSMQQPNPAVSAAWRSIWQLCENFDHVTTFFHALESLAPQIEEIFIGENLDQLPLELQTQTLVNASIMQPAMQFIKKLTISCEDNLDLEAYDVDPVWITIAESAQQLEHLRIYASDNYEPSAWEYARGGAKALNHFLNFGHYEKLSKFEVIGRPIDMTVVDAKKLDSFLRRHGQTLEEVCLENVFVAPLQMKDDGVEEIDEKKVCSSLRALLSMAGVVMPKLRCLRIGLTRYKDQWFDYRTIEALGEEFGVAEKDGVWRFAEGAAFQAQ